jgi:GTPase SAR1 family protein
LKELKTHANPDVKVFLIGNKSDLEAHRHVNKEVAEKYKEDTKLDLFMEASAKTGFNAQNVSYHLFYSRFSLKLQNYFTMITFNIKIK